MEEKQLWVVIMQQNKRLAESRCSALLDEGKQKYNVGDKMGALKLFERCLNQAPSLEQRQAALFSATAVHASFGDIELAQITLRDGIGAGLDFDAALKDPDMVKFQGSPQVVIQLRKFAEAVRRIKAAVSPDASPGRAPPRPTGPRAVLSADVSDMLRTELSGIDPSVLGVIKRVAGLLVAGLLLGTVLFYVGLKLAFPDYT
ncbi:hypothetical protein WJX81_005525 [Elliptochloris bilobata]|uniref:Uncharacterized protein n=1 Tax=Elliptochloris bilobata TaxID=381761 RepID=A0AAW1QZ61_9CHLO